MDATHATSYDGLTIQQAATRLGVKEDAVRKRIRRGTLRSVKAEDGRVYVWLDPAQDATEDTTQDAAQDSGRDELVAELRRHNEYLREQLDVRTEELREHRRIIAALTQRIPEIEAPDAPDPEPEAPQTSSEASQSAADAAPGPAPPAGGARASESPTERPLLSRLRRRVFGR
jgi:excisionase family DNA binding protein